MTEKGKLRLLPIRHPLQKACFPNKYCTKRLFFSPVIFYLLRDDFVENYVDSAAACGRIKDTRKQINDARKLEQVKMQKYINRNI
ncbi:MAG: hypothetical protein ACFFD4_14680 [Candidatus Odinarchaeota archaeon]